MRKKRIFDSFMVPKSWGTKKETSKYRILQWENQTESIECGESTFEITQIEAERYLFDIKTTKDFSNIPYSPYHEYGIYNNNAKLAVDFDTNKPIDLEQQLDNNKFNVEVKAKFHKEKVEINSISSISGIQNVNLNIPYKTIENYQLLTTLRGVNFDKIKDRTLNVVSASSGLKLEVNLDILDLEYIRVPYGEFECIKIMLNVTFPKEETQFLYFTNDENRFLVKYIRGNQTYELLDV